MPKMYALKTLLPEFEIELRSCMYPMKVMNCGATASGPAVAVAAAADVNSAHNKATPINGTSAVASTAVSAAKCACVLDLDSLGTQIQKLLKSTNDAEVITFRQDKVLQQLHELKEQLAGMRRTLGLCQKGPQHTGAYTGNNGGLREEPLHDIVINGHPKFIPYALLALKNAWKDLYTIDVKTFTHSTMSDIGAEAREFERKLSQVPVDESKPKVKVTLIWKNCEHTEMIISSTMYVPIYGEVNLIRYLGRVGPAAYRYEDSPLCNEIDAVLDICYQLLRCTTAKGRAAMIRALNNRLQKQNFFGGEQISIADIGVHSSLKRLPAIGEKDLTPALNQWRKRVQVVTLL